MHRGVDAVHAGVRISARESDRRTACPDPRPCPHQACVCRACGEKDDYSTARIAANRRFGSILRSMSRTLSGHILGPRGFVNGTISFDSSGRVGAISGSPVNANAVRDSLLPVVLPGFIDLHVHGGGGRDIMEGGDAARASRDCHARHGTTALLATTMTAPLPSSKPRFAGLRPACAQRDRAAPRACSACTSKARTSTPASSARSPTSRGPRRLDEAPRLHAAGADPAHHAGARGCRATWRHRRAARRRLPGPDRPHARQLRRRRGRRWRAARAASPTCSTR